MIPVVKPILIVSALKHEISELKKRLGGAQQIEKDGTRSFVGELEACPVVLAHTGVGEGATRVSLQKLVTETPVRSIIGIGYAGALVDDLKTGDIVVASEICRETASAGETVLNADREMVRLVLRVLTDEGRRREGRLITVEHALTDEGQKRATAERTQAIAVDMESAAVASVAEERSIPFLVLRSILDPVEATVPDPAAFMDPKRGVNAKKLTSYVLKRPQAIWQFPQLALHAKRARQSLTEAIPKIVREISK